MLKHWTTRLNGRPEDIPHAPLDEPLWHDGDGLFLHKSDSGDTAHYQQYSRDTAVALVHPAKRTISLHPLTAETTPDTLEHLLHDQIYPRLLAQEGELELHAGAVDMDGQLAVLLGDSGMGKSTLVASLQQAAALANGVPGIELSYPRDYVSLPQVHARIRAQMAKSIIANTETAHP
jgi:predicted AAA+ superfamily ATPase